MMTQKIDFAAELRQHMTQDDFPALLQRFNTSTCAEDSYAVATWMYNRFPDESRRLLPRVNGAELTFDGKGGDGGTSGEWAAALTAAKWMHAGPAGRNAPTVTPVTPSPLTEAQTHDYAKQMYDAHHKAGGATPVKSRG